MTSSTISWQRDLAHGHQAVRLLDVALELGAHLRAGAVEQHALVPLGQAEHVAGLLGREPVDVAQRDHGALRRRQRHDRGDDPLLRLAREQPLLGDAVERARRRRPRPAAGHARVDEAVGVDRGLVVVRVAERRERDACGPRARRGSWPCW